MIIKSHMKDKKTPSFDLSQLATQVKDQVHLGGTKTNKRYIPDIMEFCNAPKYLNLPANGITLFPLQAIILKVFYRGQEGNEHIVLTQEEIELLEANGLKYVLDKYYSTELFRELILVLGRRCVGEKTKIFDPITGNQNIIGKLYDDGIRKINTCSLDENDFNLYSTEKSDIIYNGVRETFRLTLQDGRTIDVTDNHPFLTIDGWKQLKELKEGDRIATPRKLNSQGSSDLSLAEASLLGFMTGDGTCTSQMYFTCADNHILDYFIGMINDFSNNLIVKKNNNNKNNGYDKYGYKIISKHLLFETVNFNGRMQTKPIKNDLAKLLQKHKLLGCNAHTKFVPEIINQSSNEIVSQYLKCLFTCDGCVYEKYCARDEKNVPAITYTTVSEKLAYGVHHLLVRFGITSKVRKRKVTSNFNTCGYSYQIDIHSTDNVNRFLNQIGFIAHEKQLKLARENTINKTYNNHIHECISKSVWTYIDKLKNDRNIKTDRELLGVKPYSGLRIRRQYEPSRETVVRINNNLQDNHLTKITNDNILWLTIKSITPVGKQRTFDISVNYENKHNFVANDIITHNSGKDMLTSLIALYEAMKLLEVPGGSPYKYYNLGVGNPLYILTIATAAEQAGILFSEIREKLRVSPYFRDKIGAIDTDKIYLKTPEDKENNKKFTGTPIKGSIIIMSGHSNSDSLLGKNYFSLLFDEVASFKMTGGPGGGDRLYAALLPGAATFARPLYKENGRETTNPVNSETAEKVLDKNGNHVKRLESKIVSISSPRGEEGIFYKLFKQSSTKVGSLAFQQPTWKVNLNLTEDLLRTEYSHFTTSEFQMEFGAQFSGTAGEKFIPARYVDEAVEIGMKLSLDQRITGQPGIIYYAHLDPASTSHNYALAVIHLEDRIRTTEKDQGVSVKEKFKLVVVDHLMVWKPSPNHMVNVGEVDKYILSLATRFRFGMVTYDAWNSMNSVQLLRSKGIPTKMTPFRRAYIMQIYSALEELLINHHIALPNKGPYADMLQQELKCLKRIYSANGFKIVPDKEAIVTTDDLADALCGAIGTALVTNRDAYPRGTTVYMPQPGTGSEQIWHIGANEYTTAGWRELQLRSGKLRR